MNASTGFGALRWWQTAMLVGSCVLAASACGETRDPHGDGDADADADADTDADVDADADTDADTDADADADADTDADADADLCQDPTPDLCDGGCVDLANDPDNCGGCGDACVVGTQYCAGGNCHSCPEDCSMWEVGVCCPSVWGGGPGCAETLYDPQNCGGCGIDCGNAGECFDGRCECWEKPGWAAMCDGLCTAIGNDPANCGRCGNVCPEDRRICSGGACTTCEAIGLADCGAAACTDTSMDPSNCGACGAPCDPGTQCVGGQCVAGDCGMDCGGEGVCCSDAWGGEGQGCTDIRYDPFNCGGCGVLCGEVGECNGGLCECWEKPGWTALCDGVCTAVGNDPANCGDCGNACPPESRICSGGDCTTCEALGMADCGDGRCTDTQWNARHCGACNNPCGQGMQCVRGGCVGGECNDDCGGEGVCCNDAWGGGAGCTDLLNDPFNCGSCAVRCPANQECWDAHCAAF